MRKRRDSSGFTPEEWRAFREGGEGAVRRLRDKRKARTARPKPAARKLSLGEFSKRLAAMTVEELTLVVNELNGLVVARRAPNPWWVRNLRDRALAALCRRREAEAVSLAA